MIDPPPNPDKRPAIVLAAHGERRGTGENRRLQTLAGELQRRIPEAKVVWALVNEAGSVGEAIAASGASRAIVLPALFSDGFFFDRLTSEVQGAGQVVAPPMALWPGFVPFLNDQLPGTQPLLLVAHGSKRPGRSAAVALEIAAGLRASGRKVQCGFLEEAPFAAQVAAAMPGPFTLAGLFLGQGLHGGEDFRALAALPGVQAAVTVGEMPGLDDLFEAAARDRLATILHS